MGISASVEFEHVSSSKFTSLVSQASQKHCYLLVILWEFKEINYYGNF